MAAYEYPGWRYGIDDRDRRCIVNNESEDKALGDSWDDPAGVRGTPAVDQTPKRGPGRPKANP